MEKQTQQREIFLDSEADAWFERNRDAVARQDFSSDPICESLLEFVQAREDGQPPLSVLEIGCGEGLRLHWLAQQLGVRVSGIEPSVKAVAAACSRGIDAKRGTAETLPWSDASFDVVLFGFCLYLCDIGDLFRIAAETNRVLKPQAWIVVHDFYAAAHAFRPYHHKQGVMSNKMDFRKLFEWHPAYTCYSHRISAHGIRGSSDDPQEWVATSVIRKHTVG